MLRFYIPLCVLLSLGACKNGESLFSKSKSNRPSPPAIAQGKINETQIRIEYSSPRVRQRQIWGELVPYGKLWRTGANEATTLQVDADLTLNGQDLPKGKYSVFTIPGEKEWTIVLNKVWDLWGSYDYEEGKDLMRLKVKPYKLETQQENMTFSINDNTITFNWDYLAFDLQLK